VLHHNNTLIETYDFVTDDYCFKKLGLVFVMDSIGSISSYIESAAQYILVQLLKKE